MIYLKLVQNTPTDPKLDSASVFYDEVGDKVYFFGAQSGPAFEMVDLGLSVKWATCNLGASSPEEYGNYYAWGETQGYADITGDKKFRWSDYKYGTSATDITKYNSTDGKTVLESSDDAVLVLGGEYRMPTKAELNELYTACTRAVVTVGGVSGMTFTASNGNSIFIPFAGYCDNGNRNLTGNYFFMWSSSRYDGNANSAWDLDGSNNGVYISNNVRYYGFSIRPVCE